MDRLMINNHKTTWGVIAENFVILQGISFSSLSLSPLTYWLNGILGKTGTRRVLSKQLLTNTFSFRKSIVVVGRRKLLSVKDDDESWVDATLVLADQLAAFWACRRGHE
jgi:hypothetical protein